MNGVRLLTRIRASVYTSNKQVACYATNSKNTEKDGSSVPVTSVEDENTDKNKENTGVRLLSRIKDKVFSRSKTVEHDGTTPKVLQEEFAKESEDEIPVTFVEETNREQIREEEIEILRNKSRLLPQHRNMVHATVPYEQAESWIHETVKYKRMLFGKYGLASGVDPRICFPSPAEAAELAEYNRVAYPKSLKEMMDTISTEKLEAKLQVQQREDKIAMNMGKLGQWTKELNERVAKKAAEARAAKARRDRLTEEVRRHFGFKVDSKDERFQEMLAQKEKEENKSLKALKRQARQAKMLEKLQQKAGENDAPAPAATETQ